MERALNREAVADKVFETAAEHFSAEPGSMSASTSIGSVGGWDSTSHVGLILGLEEAFGIEFDIAKVGDLDNLGALVDECVLLLSQREAR